MSTTSPRKSTAATLAYYAVLSLPALQVSRAPLSITRPISLDYLWYTRNNPYLEYSLPVQVKCYLLAKPGEKMNKRGVYINGRRWYHYLVCKPESLEGPTAPALMDKYSLAQLENHLVICHTRESLPGRKPSEKTLHLYTYFDFYAEFYLYLMQVEERTFYEVIFGEFPQKPHFDIDIGADELHLAYPQDDVQTVGNLLVEATVNACRAVLARVKVDISLHEHMLIYSSHGAKKCSYHVVITGHCHVDNNEAYAFYELVRKQVYLYLAGKYIEFMDHKVYSRRQQFRILGSHKTGNTRRKIFHEQFTTPSWTLCHVYPETTEDLAHKQIVALYESLVSFVSGSTLLPNFIPESVHTEWAPRSAGNELTKEDGDACLLVLEECFAALQIDSPFTVRNVQNGLIILTRHRPSACPICKREHQQENPLLWLRENLLYWDCRRRSPGSSAYFIGEYVVPSSEEATETTETTETTEAPEVEVNSEDITTKLPSDASSVTEEPAELRPVSPNYEKQEELGARPPKKAFVPRPPSAFKCAFQNTRGALLNKETTHLVVPVLGKQGGPSPFFRSAHNARW